MFDTQRSGCYILGKGSKLPQEIRIKPKSPMVAMKRIGEGRTVSRFSGSSF